MTDLILLSMLLPGPKHGYQLKQEAGVILGQRALHNNLVYPLLRRFTNDRWVMKKAVPGERGQTRQQYAITALGRTELAARLSEFSEQDARSTDAFMIRVSLLHLLKPQVRVRILDARVAYLRSRAARLDDISANFRLASFPAEVASYSQAATRSELKWIERLRRMQKKIQ